MLRVFFIKGSISSIVKVIGISVADIRVEPKFESERDSQLIYGEEVEILSEHGEFVRIRGRDGLSGYVKRRLIVDGDSREYKLKHYYDAGTMKFPFGSYLSKDLGAIDPSVGYIAAYSSKEENLMGSIYRTLGFF